MYLFEAESPTIYAEMAVLSINAGRFEDARAYFRKSTKKEPSNSHVSTDQFYLDMRLFIVTYRFGLSGLNLKKNWDALIARSG